MSDADRDEAWYWDTGVSAQQDDERAERERLELHDFAPMEDVLHHALVCAESHEPGVRLLGNLRAGDLARAIRASLLRSSAQPSALDVDALARDMDAALEHSLRPNAVDMASDVIRTVLRRHLFGGAPQDVESEK